MTVYANPINCHDSHKPSAQHIFRLILGAFLFGAGISHLTFLRGEFQAQVPRLGSGGQRLDSNPFRSCRSFTRIIPDLP
jgi:hypothetical protein